MRAAVAKIKFSFDIIIHVSKTWADLNRGENDWQIKTLNISRDWDDTPKESKEIFKKNTSSGTIQLRASYKQNK